MILMVAVSSFKDDSAFHAKLTFLWNTCSNLLSDIFHCSFLFSDMRVLFFVHLIEPDVRYP